MSSPTQAERMRAACAAVTLDISARTRAKIPEASTQMVADIVQGHVEILADLSGVLLRTPLPTPTPLEAAREAFTVAAFAEHLAHHDLQAILDDKASFDDECARLAELRSATSETTDEAFDALRALSPQPGEGS